MATRLLWYHQKIPTFLYFVWHSRTLFPATIYWKCGTQTRTRHISITNVVQRHGSEICKCFPGLHAFTGCDSVSAFSGKGKLTALKLAKRSPAFQELFQQLGMELELSHELFKSLQEFTCLMYSSNPGTKDVNELCYHLFCAWKGELESNQLPPCQDTLQKHCERANYQSAVWHRSLESSPPIPLTHWFWMVSRGWQAGHWLHDGGTGTQGCAWVPILPVQESLPVADLYLLKLKHWFAALSIFILNGDAAGTLIICQKYWS